MGTKDLSHGAATFCLAYMLLHVVPKPRAATAMRIKLHPDDTVYLDQKLQRPMHLEKSLTHICSPTHQAWIEHR